MTHFLAEIKLDLIYFGSIPPTEVYTKLALRHPIPTVHVQKKAVTAAPKPRSQNHKSQLPMNLPELWIESNGNISKQKPPSMKGVQKQPSRFQYNTCKITAKKLDQKSKYKRILKIYKI